MQTPSCGKPAARRGAVSCVVALLLFSLLPPADARTRRQRKPTPVTVALQPFLLARSVVHTVADPIVSRAPRAIATLATAPIRVAYMIPRATRPFEPDADPAEEDEQDLDPEPERVIALPEKISGSDRPMVAGSRAILRGGIAYAPARAPQSVKNAIWAANTLRRKPYIWGGGHGSFYDRGYDCSGTVSFALHGAGAIATPVPSSDFMRYGERGRGRWFTIYARPGHTFAIIAGLRLDTTDFQNGGTTGPRWHTEARDTRGYVARHPAGM